MFIEREGQLFNTVSFGAGDRTLVALGGWIGSWQLWRQPFEILSREWRCVAYDHRGAGQTTSAINELTLETMVDDVFRVLDAMGVESCWLAGESQGGMVAAMAVARQPDRFDGLIAVSSPVEWPRNADREKFVAYLEQDPARTLRAFVERCIPEPASEHLKRWTMDILREAAEDARPALVSYLYGADVSGILPVLKVPTLVIHGGADVIVAPVEGRRFAAETPGARLEILEGVGHLPTVTRPEEVAALITEFASRG